LNALLHKTFRKNAKLKKTYGHIRKLSDLSEVRFDLNPDYEPKNASKQTQWICSISQKPIEGSQKCYLMRKCGHVVNEMSWNNPHLHHGGKEVLQEIGLASAPADDSVTPQLIEQQGNGIPRSRKCMVCSLEFVAKDDLSILSATLTDYERFSMASIAPNDTTTTKKTKKRKRENADGATTRDQDSKKRVKS